MKNKILLVIAALAMLSCKKEPTIEETTVEQTATELQTLPEKQCFLKVTESKPDSSGKVIRDSIIFEMERKGDSVIGILNFKPEEKDRKLSTYKGIITGETANAIAVTKAEGSTNNEELVFKVKDNTVSIQYGEMAEGKNGLWQYKDKTATSFEVLQKVDCK